MPRRLTVALVAGLSIGVSHSVQAQAVAIRVDPGVELIAAVNRLAGRSEYNMTRVPRWRSALDSSMAPFLDHPAVAMTKRLGFGFFIPMNLAVHLSAPPEFSERSPFATSSSLHRRWKTYPDSTRAYIDLLRDFARAARFEAFMAANRPVADSAAARLRRVASGIDRAWIDRFWGGPAAMNFVLVAALTNGGASYGQEYVPPSGTPEAHAIVGVTRVDAEGMPLFDAADLPTVLHEMMHPYVTPLVREHSAAFRPSIDSLYSAVSAQMRQQSYGTWDAI